MYSLSQTSLAPTLALNELWDYNKQHGTAQDTQSKGNGER